MSAPILETTDAPSTLREPAFLTLWGGQTISLLGSYVSSLAIPLAAAITLGGSPLQLGVLGAASAAPGVLFGLLAGGWIDRFRRRPVLIVSNFARCLLLGAIPGLWLLGWLSIPLLVVVQFACATMSLLFDIAYVAHLPSLVARSDLVGANARMEISNSLARVGGPWLGGVLVQAIGAPLAVLVDSVSFLAAGVSLMLIRRTEPATPARRSDRAGILGEIAAGVRYVIAHPILRTIGLFNAGFALCNAAVTGVYVLYATQTLRLPASAIGLALGLGAVGAAIGALASGRAAARLGNRRTILAFGAVGGGGLIALPFASFGLPPLAVLVAAQFLYSLGATVYNVNQIALRQAVVPANLQGRAMATMRFMIVCCSTIGFLLGGALGELASPRATTVAVAAGMAALCAWFLTDRSWAGGNERPNAGPRA